MFHSRWLRQVTVMACLGLTAPALAHDDSLDIVAPWEINSPNPSRAGHVFLRMQVAETLTDTDRKGRLSPGLATDWQVSEDQLTWRFAIRQGVQFHDGTELTAALAADALQRAASRPGMLDQVPIAAIEGRGNDVVIVLDSPYALLPALLAHSSTQILAPASFGADGQALQVIGTGPYAVTSLQTPQRLAVTRFDAYWGEPAAIEHASYLAAPRGETRALMAQSGDADIVYTLDPASRLRLERTANVVLFAEPIPRTVAIKVNAAHPALAEREARQALSQAIDRRGIATGILRTPDAAANQLFPPALTAWHQPGLAEQRHDLEAARETLAALGWQRNAQGMLERDGQPFALTLTTFADRPELPIVATVLQDQWRQLGIDVSVNVGNASEIPAGHHDGSLDLGLMARNFGLVPDPLATLREDFGPQGGDWGAMNWSDPQLTELLETLSQTSLPPEQRQTHIAEAATLLSQAMPVIPVAWYVQTAAVTQQVEGFSIDPLERSYRLSDLRWSDT
ncbi:ABC transporter substrate-binding protein [Modicisalibacter xianhensis]|uniref:Peptide/nickel transport system substrate-binding protein n=1 Tax=Modicisalibacter xianhensis TaxID=442341 RepID=A0A1I3FU18_9GAMM|nr:ABC transporter substrate-binding protein [Halomonas xianhensis]SFI14647.1 peptide/nickel transport system substrate-binding protein [Halomonas xianhensis]